METIHRCKTCNSGDLKTVLKDVSRCDLKYNVISCLNCGLRFRNLRLDRNEIKRIYGKDYFVKEQRDFFFDNLNARITVSLNRLKLVGQFCETTGKILDIGSGIGTFLAVAKENGWEERGIEISSFAAEYSKQQGLNVVNGDFSDILNFKEKFDVITMWDVIDHAEEPINLLRSARNTLKDNSYIFIQTVIIDSLIFMLAELLSKMSLGVIKGPLLKGYSIHHSNYYSEKTIVRDIGLAGFKVIKVLREPLGHDFFSGGKLGKSLFKLLEKISTVFHKEIVCIVIAQAK